MKYFVLVLLNIFLLLPNIGIGQADSPKPILEVNPLWPGNEEYEYTSKIQVFRNDECEHCKTVTYYGTLYAGCHGMCRAQNYTIMMGKNGEVLRFVPEKSNLERHNPESSSQHSALEKIEYDRLVEMVNDKKALEQAYGLVGNPSYAADMSSYTKKKYEDQANFHGAGNTVMTFLIHISKVRKAMGLVSYPLYEGDRVGAVAVHTVEPRKISSLTSESKNKKTAAKKNRIDNTSRATSTSDQPEFREATKIKHPGYNQSR